MIRKWKRFWLLSLYSSGCFSAYSSNSFFHFERISIPFGRQKVFQRWLFCGMEKRIWLQADLVETQNLSQEQDLILWRRWNYSSSSHLRQAHSEVSKISSIWYRSPPKLADPFLQPQTRRGFHGVAPVRHETSCPSPEIYFLYKLRNTAATNLINICWHILRSHALSF